MPDGGANQLGLYLQDLQDLGWTYINLGSHRLGAESWLEDRLGESSDFENYDARAMTGRWEILGDGTYLIQDRDVAVLFKLTWGGR